MTTSLLLKASRVGSAVLALLMIVMSMGLALAKPPASKADLAVSVSDSPDPARTGSIVTYSILVSNAGPSQGTGVKVIDSYPAESTVVSAKTNQGSCDIGEKVICSLGNVPSRGTVEVIVELKSYMPGSLVNSVAVSGEQNDPARSNNSASTTTEIYDCSLCPTITITDTPDPAVAGEAVTYNIQGVAWGGSAVERGTQIVMRLPEGTEFLGAHGFSCCTHVAVRCSYADRTVTCGGGTNPKAAIAVRPLAAGQLTVEASLFIWGYSSPSASESAVTSVGPSRAPATNTPAPVWDEAENQQEALEAEVYKARDSAIETATELKEQAEYRIEATKQEVLRLVCRLTCRPL